MTPLQMVDTHTHLTDARFAKDRAQLLERMNQDGLAFCVEIGSNLEASNASIALAYAHEQVYACVGVHPHNAKDLDASGLEQLRQWAQLDRCVGVGEIGLDFYRDLSPRDIQIDAFLAQYRMAKEVGRPVVLHVRDAYDKMIALLKKEGLPAQGGVVHSFSMDWQTARPLLDLGWHLGIGGPCTYPKNTALREVLQKAPLERLLTETDCPYLPPVPLRGKRNEPAYLQYILEQILSLRKEPKDTVIRQLVENARRLFSIE